MRRRGETFTVKAIQVQASPLREQDLDSAVIIFAFAELEKHTAFHIIYHASGF
jgi:hypothetical protein